MTSTTYEVWRFIIAEVMATTDADPVVVDTFLAFAAGIGMVPIRKEKPRGPVEIFGVIGLSAPCGIAWHGDEDQQRIAAWFKASYLGQG
ncbi:3-hydroxybutyryl-CoA dehydrogenase, partial [Amycolatopsis rubida]